MGSIPTGMKRFQKAHALAVARERLLIHIVRVPQVSILRPGIAQGFSRSSVSAPTPSDSIPRAKRVNLANCFFHRPSSRTNAGSCFHLRQSKTTPPRERDFAENPRPWPIIPTNAANHRSDEEKSASSPRREGPRLVLDAKKLIFLPRSWCNLRGTFQALAD